MKLSGVSIFFRITKNTLKPNSLYRAARFANFEAVLGFSVPSNTCLLMIGAFSSTFLFLCFKVRIDQFSLKIFLIFVILVFCKKKAMSASYPRQKFHSSSRFPSLFLSSLKSFSVLFLRDKLGERVAL